MKIISMCKEGKVSKSGEREKGERCGDPDAAGRGEVMSKMTIATCPHRQCSEEGTGDTNEEGRDSRN